GFRNYYCLFHPKYISMSTVGRFAGLDEEEDEEESEAMSYASRNDECNKLLARLPTWLDALLEGTLRRFPVDRWPNMSNLESGSGVTKTNQQEELSTSAQTDDGNEEE